MLAGVGVDCRTEELDIPRLRLTEGEGEGRPSESRESEWRDR